MKASKKLGLVITVLQLAGFIAFITSIHTIIVILNTSLPTGQQQITSQMGDPVLIPFTLQPRNDGLLEAKLAVSLSLVADSKIIDRDSATLSLPAGSAFPVDLVLRIPLEEFQELAEELDTLKWVVDVKVTTLFGLISFSDTMTTTGGT